MHAPLRVSMACTALVLVLAGAAVAAPSASLEQVRNGPADAVATPVPTWETGNAGASNSHYLESHSIAYRAVMDQLPTDGTVVELVLGYDVKRSGSYALDYLTHYQRLLPHVLFGHREPEGFDPLSGVTGVGADFTVAPIPLPTRNVLIDPDGADPEPAALQPSTSMAALPEAERVMTLYGGTLLDVSNVTEADVDPATGSSESQVRVRFVANGPKAVLAWGGHIACRWDWGFNPDGSPRSAGGISGSSYHMRLVTWNLGNLGNQDRSMSTDAVYPVPRCGISNLGPFCAGTTNTHGAPAGMETYSWSLFDNTCGAAIVGSATGLSVTVSTATAGGYGLLLTTGASGFTRQCQATVTVNPTVTADAGADRVACASDPRVALAGSAVGGTGRWSGGGGSYSPGATALDAVYTLSAAEVAAGGVDLTLTCTPFAGPCPPVTDAVRITVQPVATAYAGPDQAVCASSPGVRLAGSVGSGATAGTWSGGTGTFSPGPSALDATYVPSAAEVTAGGVTLTLTTDDPPGPCPAASDQVVITVAPVATVGAGPDQRLCAGSPQLRLAGSVGGAAAGGTWSGGAGTFSPRATALDASYSPTPAEIAAGHVTLTLTTDDPAGPCPAVSDAMTVLFDPVTTVDAGPDASVCSSSPQVRLQGSVGGTVSSGTWSGGTGTFSPGRAVLDPTYVPSAAEIAAGTVTLTLTSVASAGPCPQASDAVTITIVPAITVDAGPDQVVCAASPQVRLAGVPGPGVGICMWGGGRGTYEPSFTAPNALYTPTAAEVAAGSVTLTLLTNDPPGPCPAVSDQVTLTFDAPVVTVPDRVVCTGISPVTMCAEPGRGVGPYTFQWSTGATTRCISVADTGRYVVTVTDAKGCSATGGGVFRQRDCRGQLAHTSTTCDSWMAGTGDDLSEVNLVLRDGVITSISPGVFFYFSKVVAPRADFTVELLQVRSNPAFPYCEVQQDQVVLYDSDCVRTGTGAATLPGQAAVEIKGAVPGQVFIVSVKYSLKSLVGTPIGSGCHYEFLTEIDGQIVDSDPDGLQVGGVGTADVPGSGLGGVALYRPTPNPFTRRTHIVYAVPEAGERVVIGVYDIAGRCVRTLADGPAGAGLHAVEWDGLGSHGERLRVGTYFVHLRVGDRAKQVRVTYLR